MAPRSLSDHIYGIPNRYVKEGDPYRKQCEETADPRAKKLNLDNNNWTLSFQSFWKRAMARTVYRRNLRGIWKTRYQKATNMLSRFYIRLSETIDEIGREV